MFGRSLRCLLLVLVAWGVTYGQANYTKDVEKWRAEHAAEVSSDSGWLSLAGLFWLQKGSNSVGSGDGFAVSLTNNFKGGKFGAIDFDGDKAILTVEDGIEARSGGRTIKTL